MNKILYIIPGWEEDCAEKHYQLLAKVAKDKSYEVIFKDVDWEKPLSHQIFAVPEDAIIFGFSLGAILAWLVAQNYPCKKVILASMTPHYSFTNPEIKKALIDLAGNPFVEDIIQNLKPKNKASSQKIMYGDLEDEAGDILVLNTEHELSDNYIEEITKLL